MKKLYLPLLLLLIGFTAQAQDCKKTCEIQKEVNQGVLLGVQITSCTCKNPQPKIVKIIEGSQAEAMGLQKGDIIHEINDVPMTDTPFMVDWVGTHKGGDQVRIELTRKEKDMVISGELGFKTTETITETICCDETVGILELKGTKVFPNPSRGEFVLQFEVENEAPIDARIVDLQGNIIQEFTINPKGNQVFERIVLNAQVAGDHIIILNQDGLTTERKVVFVK